MTTTNEKNNEFDIFNGLKPEMINSQALYLLKEKRKGKIFKEKGLKTFSEKNELEYINEIKRQKLLLSQISEKKTILGKNLHNIEINYRKKNENLMSIIKAKEISINKQNSIIEDLEEGIINFEKSSSEEILLFKKAIKKLNDENEKERNLNEKKEKELKIAKNKYDKQANELLEIKEKIKKFQENQKNEQSENICCICMSAKPDYACFPCGHKKFCENCLKNINVCSICKTKIEGTLIIN